MVVRPPDRTLGCRAGDWDHCNPGRHHTIGTNRSGSQPRGPPPSNNVEDSRFCRDILRRRCKQSSGNNHRDTPCSYPAPHTLRCCRYTAARKHRNWSTNALGSIPLFPDRHTPGHARIARPKWCHYRNRGRRIESLSTDQTTTYIPISYVASFRL